MIEIYSKNKFFSSRLNFESNIFRAIIETDPNDNSTK